MFAPIVNDKKPSAPVFSSAPTADADVRAELRRLDQPEALPNEENADRRERLITFLHTSDKEVTQSTEMGAVQMEGVSVDSDEMDSDGKSDDEEFYTPGTDELLSARKHILEISIKRASSRNSQQRAQASLNPTKVLRHRRAIVHSVSTYELLGSYNVQGNTRAVSCVRINVSENTTACSSWDGGIYIFQGNPAEELKQVARSAPGFHHEKTVLSWRNEETLISGCAEGTLNVWKVGQENDLRPKFTLRNAHDARIAQLDSHPSSDYFCTSSFDQTWKLWDFQRPEKSLLEQEGHAKEVFACKFHPDGSLLATGGLDAVGRVWDLRSGRSIAALQGHSQGIYSMAWSPNGHHLASGSGDNSIKIWDMRKPESASFTIPAHTKLVSDITFVQGANTSKLAQPVADENDQNPSVLDICGTLLVSASYDGTIKAWSSDNWILAKTLRGHTDKVMSCDISCSGESIVSSGWDRTVRTWGVH